MSLLEAVRRNREVAERERREREHERKQHDEALVRQQRQLRSVFAMTSTSNKRIHQREKEEVTRKKNRKVVLVVHPKAFYGGKHWRKKDKELAVSSGAANSVWYDTFKTFPRQGLMFDFVDKQKPLDEEKETQQQHENQTEPLHYFTYETHGTKKRVFLCTTLRRFWRHYSVMPRFKRHFYELIRQGSPCKMYYDLEFPLELNRAQAEAGVGDRLVDMTIELTCEEVLDRFGISLDKSEIVELDSTTGRKFSRHLTIPLGKDKALASNAHAGAIAAAVVGRIYEKIAFGDDSESNRFKQLLVRGSEDSDRLSPFIDLSVYSRNRTFRIFRSSKCGKDVELIPTKRYFGRLWHQSTRTDAPGVDAMTVTSAASGGGSSAEKHTEQQGACVIDDRLIFMHSLICSVPSSSTATELLLCQEVVEAASVSKKFKPTNALNNPYEESKPGTSQGQPGGNNSSKKKSSSSSIEEGEGHLHKFPMLTRFIESSKSPDGTPRLIRSYVMFQETATIILNLKLNRYCGNIQRQHKSNGVFLVVDFKFGHFYQKCYDPNCRHFRAESEVLPLDVMTELNSVFECDEDDDDDDYRVQKELEDETFLMAVEELEKKHLGSS